MSQQPTKFETIEASWKQLFERLKWWDLGLFVGAGLSIANRLPSWAELTARLSSSRRERVESLVRQGVPLVSQLNLAREQVLGQGGETLWLERVHEALYRGFKAQLAQRGIDLDETAAHWQSGKADEKALRGRAAKVFRGTNPALVELVSMCSVRGRRVPTPRVVAVLTTNLDSLLQLCDWSVNGASRQLTTIERSNRPSDVGVVSLYHLNGYVNLFSDAALQAGTADRLVLTEEEYTHRNDSPNHWAATTLHWLFRECPVLFVGCSMNDSLVRRALYRTRRERLTDLQSEKLRTRRRYSGAKHFVVREYPKSRETAAALQRSDELMDVRPVWVRDWSELSDRLRQVREALEERA